MGVLRAMEAVPRERLVPEPQAALAHRGTPLPIGCGQTTPDPLALARVLEALDVDPAHRVLEVGTGSGYGTALLAALGGEVISVERFGGLAEPARTRLADLGLSNVSVRWADGLAEDASLGRFDRVVVHPGLAGDPDALLPRLADEGVLIYPALTGTGPCSPRCGARARRSGAPRCGPAKSRRPSRAARPCCSA